VLFLGITEPRRTMIINFNYTVESCTKGESQGSTHTGGWVRLPG